MNESSNTNGDREPLTLESLARQVNYVSWFDDWGNAMLEDRVVRLEEIIAASWPRRWLLRRRLARELRASVAEYGDSMPPDFRKRRIEFAGETLILRTLQAEHRGRGDAS